MSKHRNLNKRYSYLHGSLNCLSIRCKDEAKAKRDKAMMYNKGGESRQQALEEDYEPEEDGSEGGDGGGGSSRRCCCRWIISQVQAFKEQMNRVEELFLAAGHVCIFLAK